MDKINGLTLDGLYSYSLKYKIWDIVDMNNSAQTLRRQLSDIHAEIASLRFMKALAQLSAFHRKFDPAQPRDELGRWTDGATAGRSALDAFAAKRGSVAECEAQYKLDSITCRLVASRVCWQQAMARRAACVSGYPLPPLNW